MKKEIAEIFAHCATFSSAIPLSLGIVYWKALKPFYRYIWASIGLSFLFDALSYVPVNIEGFSHNIAFLYSVLAILVMYLAFRTLFNLNSLKTPLFDFFLVFIIGLALFFGISEDGSIAAFYPGLTVAHLYIVGLSTFLVMYYLSVKKELLSIDRPLIVVFSSNIVYFTTVVAIFIFFDSFEVGEIMKIYTVKWILFILYNLVLAYIFYHVGKGKWKTA